MDREDLLIKKFLEQLPAERASANFTSHVMERVEQTQVTPARHEIGDWIFGLIAVAASLLGFVVYFVFNQDFVVQLFGDVSDYVSQLATATGLEFSRISFENTMEINPIWVAAILVPVLLLILDRLLQKRFHTNMFFMM